GHGPARLLQALSRDDAGGAGGPLQELPSRRAARIPRSGAEDRCPQRALRGQGHARGLAVPRVHPELQPDAGTLKAYVSLGALVAIFVATRIALLPPHVRPADAGP